MATNNTVNKISSQNNQSYTISTSTSSQPQNISLIFSILLSNDDQLEKTINIIRFIVDAYLSPIISGFSLILNILNIFVFSDSKMLSPIYKYLLANSIFDCIHIVVSQMRQFFKYRSFYGLFSYDFLELYFYTYLSSISFLCSNIIKVAFSLERYFRMKGICKIYLKKSSFKWILLSTIIFSIFNNSIILFSNNFFTDYSSRKYVFFLTLNMEGFNSKTGLFLNMLAIFLDIGVFVLIIFINVLLLIEIEKKNKLIKNLIGQTSAYFFTDNETSDINENDYLENEVTSISPSYTENSVQLEQNQDIRMKNLTVTNSIKNTSKTIFATIVLYVISHLLFSILLIWIQTNYYIKLGPMLNSLFENFYIFKLLISLANILLYLSFGLNFFVYYFYNKLFNNVLKSLFKKCFI